MSGTVGKDIAGLPTATQANLTDIIPATQGASGPLTGNTVGVTPQQMFAIPGLGNVLQFTAPFTGTVARTFAAVQGDVCNLKDFGAKGDNVTDDTAAVKAWLTAVMATGAEGYAPAGTYNCTSAISINLASIAKSGLKLTGAGGNRTIFNITNAGTSIPIAWSIFVSGGTVAAPAGAFYVTMRDFSIISNNNGATLQIGNNDFSDAINGPILDGLVIGNTNTGTSTVAVRLNYVLLGNLNVVANCNGVGDALQMRQATFNTITGSYSTATVGVHLETGYNFGNVFLGLDQENLATCVQFDSINATRNVFLGGTYVWTTVAINAVSCSNWNKFIQGNFGSGSNILTGAASSAVLVDTILPSNTGNSAQNNVGTTNQVFQDTGFTGGIGPTPYTIGQIVAALKNLALIQS